MLLHIPSDNFRDAVLNVLDFLSGRIVSGTSEKNLDLLFCELLSNALVEGKETLVAGETHGEEAEVRKVV